MVYEALDWAVALVPVLVMLVMFIWLDVFKLMTLWETLGLLVLGALTAAAAYPVSGTFLDALPLGFSNYSRFVAPWRRAGQGPRDRRPLLVQPHRLQA